MGKQNKKNNQAPEVRYENKGGTQKKFRDRDDHERRHERERRPRPEAHPVAKLMLETFSNDITTFLGGDIHERDVISTDLFNIKNYPSQLRGCDGAEDYEIFLLERTVRKDKKDQSKFARCSMSAVLLSKETHQPAFFVTCYITPNDVGGVTVYTQGENGTEYAKTIRWSNKD